MATDFTQDTLLHFLQSRGGSVKNSDLLLHFRSFIRDHNDQNRNRELFKKFVNSVATVKQIDGVSFVVLRKKFKGHVPGGGEWGSAEPPRLHAGKNTEPSPRNNTPSPAGSAEKPGQKPQPREATTPAPLGGTARKTVLPVAGIVVNNNNNNVEAILNLKQQQGVGTRDLSGGAAAAAQVVSPTPEITAVKTPSVSEPHPPTAGQHRSGSRPPPGITSAVKPHGETSQQVPGPGTLRGREGLHQEPPLHHHTSLQQNVAPRRIRHRPSYKSAVSYDEDGDEEEEEEVQLRRGSAGGAWPQSTPLRDMGRAISASSPCIIDTPAHPSVVSSSSSSERQIPKIFVQNVNAMGPAGPGWSSVSGEGHRGQWSGSGLEPGSAPGESSSVRRSLPLEAEHYMASHGAEPHHNVHADPPYSQPLGVHLEPSQSQATMLSSSHSSIFSPTSDAGFSSSDWPPSGSPRGSGWNSSCENLKPRAGGKSGGSQIQEVLQRAQGKTSESVHPASSKTTAPWHHSTGHLHDDQHSSARVVPWHLSTGDLYDDREDAESSEGSTSSPPLRPRPAVARRLSSHLRSRMCRSLGANLDQLLQEEESGAGGGSEATRLNRLHMISSSLSLRYNLSSSSLSSCSTPPHYQSLNDLDERGRRSSPIAACPTAQPEASHKQSLVPLEPREHSWLVKGAAGAWPDIYTLFREDSSLLNRRDFISGFTVLHWIAKHGDHRVLNTLWYGVQKAGLTFDMNAKSTCGHTPLHIAAIHGNKNIMRLLVNKFNADVKLRDTAGKKAWQYLSLTTPPEVFQLLGAPTRPPEGPGGRDDPAVEQQQRRRRRRHHLSFASSGERPKTMTGTTRVKRSSSIAAFLKHKSLHMFPRQGESSI